MDKSGASAYVYAKASGMLANSFVGERASQIFSAKTLPELYSLLFKSTVPLVPEFILAKQIEKQSEQKFISDFTMLLDCFSKPEPVSVALLQFYDYCNLKDIVHALSNNEKDLPELVDIGKFSTLHLDQWPNLKKITLGTPFEWYNTIPAPEDQKSLDYKLDLQYTLALWKAVKKLPSSEIQPVKELILQKLTLDNCVWATRLRTYYKMEKSEVIKNLFSESENPTEKDILSGEAIKTLNFDLDSFQAWSTWKHKSLLNPNIDGNVWFVDPIWMQQEVKLKINKLALSQFHKHPFTADVLVSWFFIKQHELDCIRTAAEGLRLGVTK